MKGRTIVTLTGNPYDRGYAHGQLLGTYIMDFFRYFILETVVQDSALYEKSIVPFLKSNFTISDNMKTEMQAIVDGMRASGISLFVEELNRTLEMIDIFTINAYIEVEFFTYKGINPYPSSGFILNPKKSPICSGACTQFVTWGDQTQTTTLDGKLIAGRNMDGELDVRKVTVSHVIIFVVDPTESTEKYVSVMWPGFVGTLSSVNQDGVYAMMNVGTLGNSLTVHGATVVTWLVREVIASVNPTSFSPSSVKKILDGMKSKAGGSCVTGCILVFANLYDGHSNSIPAFIFESDYAGKKLYFFRCF